MSEEKQERPPVLSIKMVPAGIEMVIAALRKFPAPHEQIDPLIKEIAGQYGYQMQQLQVAAEKKSVDQQTAAPVKKIVKKVTKK